MYTYLLLLLAGLMCCTNAAENRNNEETSGGETYQNDPNYESIAEDVDNYYSMRMHNKGVNNGRNRVKLDVKYENIAKQAIQEYLNDVIDKSTIRSIDYIRTPVYKQKLMYVNFDVTQGSLTKICTVIFILPQHKVLNGTSCTTDEQVAGGFEWVDPSPPKYVHLAEKSLFKSNSASLRSRPLRGYDTIVTFVMRQVVAGSNYHINFIIRPVNHHEYNCFSTVYENTHRQILVEDVSCQLQTKSKPKPTPSDPNTRKYREIGKSVVEDYLKNEMNKPDFVDIVIKNNAIVTTRVLHKDMFYVNYEAIYKKPTPNTLCSVVFELPQRESLNIKCMNVVIGAEWRDPSDEKYIDIAEKADMFPNNKHDDIVTFVTQLVTADTIYVIDYIARPVNKKTYECGMKYNAKDKTYDDLSCHQHRNFSSPSSDSSDF